MTVEIKYRELESNSPNRFENKFWPIRTVESKTKTLLNTEIDGDLGLDIHKITEAKLYPIAEFNFNDTKISISREFYGRSDYPTVLGYVEKNGKTFLCTFYKSSSSAMWRYLPGYEYTQSNDIHFSKGHSSTLSLERSVSGSFEHTLNIPTEMQKALSEFLEGNPEFKKGNSIYEDADKIIEQNKDMYFLGTTRNVDKFHPTNRYFEEMPSKERTIFGKFLKGKNIHTLEKKGSRVALPKPELVTLSDSQSPNFSQEITSWKVPESEFIYFEGESNMPKKEPLIYRVYFSQDRRLIFTFCTTEITKKSFCADIQTNSKEITSFGCRKNWIDPGCLTTPPYDYPSQAFMLGSNFTDTYSTKLVGNYSDISESYVAKLQLIKQYTANIE